MASDPIRAWREVRDEGRWNDAVDAGDALAAALDAREREHDAAIGRMVGEIEARDRIIAELEAGLETAAELLREASGMADDVGAPVAALEWAEGYNAARNLLAARLTGGEG